MKMKFIGPHDIGLDYPINDEIEQGWREALARAGAAANTEERSNMVADAVRALDQRSADGYKKVNRAICTALDNWTVDLSVADIMLLESVTKEISYAPVTGGRWVWPEK